MTLKIIARKRGMVTFKLISQGKTIVKRLNDMELINRYGKLIWLEAIREVRNAEI